MLSRDGLDVHKDFLQVCCLSPDGRRRKDFRIAATEQAIEAFALRLTPHDQVALEVTFHTRAIYALLVPHAGRVVAVNAVQVKAIASAKIKTDKVDAWTLAQLLRADFLPAVQMPSSATWALRQMGSHRRLLLKQQTATKNTIHAILNRRLIRLPEGWTPFAQKTRHWMRELELPAAERFMLDNALELLEQIETRIAAVDDQLLRHAKRGHNVAVTALARKLIHVVWHLLERREPYRYAPVPRTRAKLLRVTCRQRRTRPVPRTLDDVYAEAGLPALPRPSSGERRSVANNRRTRTRLAKRAAKPAQLHEMRRETSNDLTHS